MNKIYEVTYNEFLKKQSSIGKLYPTFGDRVKAVAKRGGVRLVEMLPEVWHFKVNSGTQEGVRYDTYMRFKNMVEVLTKWVFNKTMWLKNAEHVDYRKLAAEVMNEVDLEFDCSCPSNTYSGFKYLRTQDDAQYGDKENRPPVEKNPGGFGFACKHGMLCLQVLPFYVSTFSSFLKKYWESEILDIEDLYKQEIRAGEEENEDVPTSLEPNVAKGSKIREIPTETEQGEEIATKTSKGTANKENPVEPVKTKKSNIATKPAKSATRPASKGDYYVG